MTATAHALIGGTIAASFSNPAVGLPLAVISHPLMDLIPHWDFAADWRTKNKIRLFIEASIDVSFGTILAYILFGQNVNLWYFLGCIIASEILDIIEAPYWLLDWRFPPISWVYNIQSKMQGKAALPWGIITQIITVVIVAFILLSLHTPQI